MSPNLGDLRARYSRPLSAGGTFEYKCRKSVEGAWEDIARFALVYWERVNKPWKDATPKAVEKEYEELEAALTALIVAMKGLSSKAMGLAWDLSREGAKEEKGYPPTKSIREHIEVRLNRDPIHDAWAKCDGNSWFIEHVSRELRDLTRKGENHKDLKGLLDDRNRLFDWGRLRELPHAVRIAQHLRARATSIKMERSPLGRAGTWTDDQAENDPKGVLCRAIRDALVDRKLFKTHAGPIAREIFIWAHPDLPEEKWPSVKFFGGRYLK